MQKISKKSIPNILTIIRIIFAILAILFACLYGIKDSLFYRSLYKYSLLGVELNIPITYVITGCIFAIASATDWLDGYLARKHNWISDFGKLWDPIADKILVDGILITLAINHSIPVFIPIIMICRDIVVDAMRMYASSKGIVVAANIWGKLKTIIQMIAIITTLFVFGIFPNDIESKYLYVFYVINSLHLIACVFSITSRIIYGLNINKEVKETNAKK